MKSMSFYSVIAILLLASIILASCSPNQITPSSPTGTSLSTSIPTLDPIGTAVQLSLETATLLPGEQILTSPAEINGLWHSFYQRDPAIVRFEMDGTYELAKNEKQLETNPIIRGKFWFEGIYLVAKDNKCREGTYEIRILKKEGQPAFLNFIKVSDNCTVRASDWRRGMNAVQP